MKEGRKEGRKAIDPGRKVRREDGRPKQIATERQREK
jgi:hypothetical protein